MTDIIEASPDLVWVKDLNGVYQSCNAAYAFYLGRDVDQIVGKNDHDLTTHEQAEMYLAHDRRTIAGRKPTRVEERHTPAHGSQEQLFEVVKTPVLSAVGDIMGVQGIARNITERRAVEDELMAANAQRRMLELCIAKLNDVVVITEAEPIDMPGPRVVFVNDAFERMTGYSRAETLGQSPRKLQGAKTQRSELDRIRQAIAQWKPVHAELINYKKSGEAFWVELDIVPVANEVGWYTHWIAVQRDITQRKAADAEMLLICDRAMEASRLKSEFLSSISHEMRTPMNGVIGMAQVLQGTPLTDTQQMYVAHIVRAAQDYTQVIEKALDFSKASAGNLAIDSRPLELLPLLQACEQAMINPAQAKKLQLQMVLDPHLPNTVLGDERRLKQCVMILLDNAVKFTAQGYIELRVHVVDADRQVRSLRFEVCDTGIGLSKSDHERLFYPLVQGDGSITRRYGGVGLGLVLCKQLVELMQGRIGVDSTKGQGSTFWFELPLRVVA